MHDEVRSNGNPGPDPAGAIADWHAHVYFDAASRDAALALRAGLDAAFGARVALGRVHDRPVGPHPCWSYQIAFAPDVLGGLVAWLALHHGALDVLLHPNTGDALRDHRDRALWFGHSHDLALQAVGG